MVEMSQSAARHLAELLAAGGRGLCISLERGWCTGLGYVMSLGFQGDGDVVLTCEGSRVFVDQEGVPYLSGSTLNYEDFLNGSGFHIQNPQASRSCGCGTEIAS
ncbi:Iron-sulfur cluster insertion protein ErpA [Candidatus Xiphinematobacter sp. Idaho Grape]|uniref:HesB/IscA family protein n=1 Tax=Candidatus Xiphinematobacter sp. Idaho Grape TaxID=1704307 RepID=UPI0007056920|nr:iron-sulfur cluster assembly accessory protein [Candidatus Xiphinematobacter sp. Idaho Grape]ALJ56800.1 Iron-sulfur cluster insertion protein ErpA [Candidatus Xiphinematobacter sp. Idaho Grape]